jgi:hypothetical protein
VEPLESIRLEIATRYLENHFLPSDSGPYARLKVLILAAYVAAMVLLVVTPGLRRHAGYRLLLYLTGLRFLMMAWGTVKNEYYLVDILPFFAFFLACATCWLWQRSHRVRWATVLVLCVVVGLQLSWSLQRILWLRPYQTQYLPAIRFLREHMTPEDLVCGSADLAFGLGLDNPQIVDDLWMGRWSGRRPTVVVLDHWYYDVVVNVDKESPEHHRYVNELLREQFHEIYVQPERYEIYRRN